MLNFISNNLFNFSALEQFEILTFFFPDLGNIFTFILWTLVPGEIINNINLTLVLVLFYLSTVSELKTRNFYEDGFANEYNGIALSVETEFNTTSVFLKNLLVYTKNDKFEASLTNESMYIFYNIINFVYTQILENLSYKKPVFLNYAITLFTFLLVCNVLGMVPYSLTITSYLIITLHLSGMSFFGNLLIGLRIYGWDFFKFFIPGGVSGPLLILMVVIELISYVTRLFSMAIRLFANMLSGHALIKILSGLVFLSLSDLYFFGIINGMFNLVVIAVTALEVIVAGLQAYVFVILSVVYTNESIVLH